MSIWAVKHGANGLFFLKERGHEVKGGSKWVWVREESGEVGSEYKQNRLCEILRELLQILKDSTKIGNLSPVSPELCSQGMQDFSNYTVILHPCVFVCLLL